MKLLSTQAPHSARLKPNQNENLIMHGYRYRKTHQTKQPIPNQIEQELPAIYYVSPISWILNENILGNLKT